MEIISMQKFTFLYVTHTLLESKIPGIDHRLNWHDWAAGADSWAESGCEMNYM